MSDPLLVVFVIGIIAILVASCIVRWILKKQTGTPRMQEVGNDIVLGTSAYLNRQLKTIILIIPWLAVVIIFFFGWTTSLAFGCAW